MPHGLIIGDHVHPHSSATGPSGGIPTSDTNGSAVSVAPASMQQSDMPLFNTPFRYPPQTSLFEMSKSQSIEFTIDNLLKPDISTTAPTSYTSSSTAAPASSLPYHPNTIPPPSILGAMPFTDLMPLAPSTQQFTPMISGSTSLGNPQLPLIQWMWNSIVQPQELPELPSDSEPPKEGQDRGKLSISVWSPF